MKTLVLVAMLAQVPDAPVAYRVPAGSIVAIPTPDGPPDISQLPAGFFVPEPSMKKLEADTRTLRANLALRNAEASEGKQQLIITAAIAAALGLVLGAGVMCAVDGPTCPIAKAFK